MGALDKRLYTSHHAPTDTVARVGPDYVKLALNGCSFLQSTARLSARLAYQRTLMNPYCMFDPADLTSERIGALSRSHTTGPASTSLVSDAKTCPTQKTLRPLQQQVVAPAVAGALVAMTIATSLELPRFYST